MAYSLESIMTNTNQLQTNYYSSFEYPQQTSENKYKYSRYCYSFTIGDISFRILYILLIHINTKQGVNWFHDFSWKSDTCTVAKATWFCQGQLVKLSRNYWQWRGIVLENHSQESGGVWSEFRADRKVVMIDVFSHSSWTS